MRKMLRETVSPYPRSTASLYHKKQKLHVVLIFVAVIVLSPAYQHTLGIENYQQEHAHRHHRLLPRLYRVIRNPQKKIEQDELPTLNSCSENISYPSHWKRIMENLDNEKELYTSKIKSEEQYQAFLTKYHELLSQQNPNHIAAACIEAMAKDEDKILDIGKMSKTSEDERNNVWLPHLELLQGTNGQIGKFSMHELGKHFDCPSEKRNTELHWHSFFGINKLRGHNISTNITPLVFSNLSLSAKDEKLVWNSPDGYQFFLEKNEYCVWKWESEWATFKVCLPNCSELSPCVRKCCPPSEVIDEKEKACKPTTPEWRPKFYRTAGDTETLEHDVSNASVAFINGFPNCVDKYIIKINESPKSNFKLLLNGTLVHIEKDTRAYIHPKDFCIDGLYYSKSEERKRIFEGSEWDQIVIACKPTQSDRLKFDKIRIRAYAVLNFISAIFLLLTDVVYILIWRHQNNIHSWLQFSYTTSLLFTFTCFAIVQTWSDSLITFSYLCKVMGWLNYLTYLSAFFWLTSMNFDLWWRFSRPLRSTRVQTQDKKRKRFLGFAVFSTVVPLLISSIGIILDYKYGDDLLPPITLPGFGKEKCYFKDKHSQIPYLYLPAGILLLVDFIFFASTVLHLRKMHTHTELARTQSTSTMEDKKGVRVIAKLFVIMGVLWIFELLSWICQLVFTRPDQEMILLIIFTPLDCLNSIQGVFIFFIFICKPNVRNQLSALFKRDDAAKTWNKQTQLPSETTVQQPPAIQNECVEIN